MTSPDKTVEFIIKADDFSKEETDKLSVWSEDLQLYRQQLYQLTGERQPYDGKTIFDFTEQIDYYGPGRQSDFYEQQQSYKRFVHR